MLQLFIKTFNSNARIPFRSLALFSPKFGDHPKSKDTDVSKNSGKKPDSNSNNHSGIPDPDRPFNADHVYKKFPENTNPITGEIGGPTGPEPTRYGDWERKGRVSDF